MNGTRACLLLSVIGLSQTALAQTGPLIIDQNRVDRKAEPAPTVSTEPKGPRGEVRAEAAGDQGVTLRQVRVEGSAIDRQAIGNATQKFIGRPITRDILQALGNAVADVYAQSVVALYSVYVPEQDLSGGEVRLVISEGYIADVQVKGEGKHKLVERYAAKLKGQRPLLRATLERYLSLIRDIPGLTADAQLLRASAPGAVRLVLDVKREPLTSTFSLDNRGTALLGGVQFGNTTTANGLIREGDQTQVNLSTAGDFEKYRFAALSHSTPLGNEGARVSGSFGYLRTRPTRVPIDGDARTAGVQVSYPLIRSYTRNASLTGALDGVDSDNAVFGQTFSSEHTRALRAAVGYVEGSKKRTIGGSAALSRGLDIFGARGSGLGALDFTKLNVRGQFDQALSQSIVMRLRASGQYSGDRLPGVEQFALGGEFGRAFQGAIVTGDLGVAGIIELGWHPAGLPDLFKGSELYSFIDGGIARYRSRTLVAERESELASLGLGMRAQLGRKSWIGLEGAHALEEPLARDGHSWRAIVSWQISL